MNRDRVRLALHKSLVGQVTPTMRLVSFEANDDSIQVVVYFDRQCDEADQLEFAGEVASCVGLDLGDPPQGPVVRCHFLRCDDPQFVPVRGEVAFARKEARVLW